LDVRYMNPFLVATRDVFKTMLGVDVSLQKPVLKMEKTTSGDITGVMGFSGDKKGAVAVSFSLNGGIFVYTKVTGESCNEAGAEVIDAIGELTNIISGQARREFEKMGIIIKAGIPMVIKGINTQLHFITNPPIISLPFAYQAGNGTVETLHVDFSFENLNGEDLNG